MNIIYNVSNLMHGFVIVSEKFGGKKKVKNIMYSYLLRCSLKLYFNHNI